MPDLVNEKVKKERSDIIRGISDENKWNYYSLFFGKEQQVLVEKVSLNSMAKGYGENYIPVEFLADRQAQNRFIKVRIGTVKRTMKNMQLEAITIG